MPSYEINDKLTINCSNVTTVEIVNDNYANVRLLDGQIIVVTKAQAEEIIDKL